MVLTSLEASRDKIYNINRLQESNFQREQNSNVKKILMTNSLFLPALVLACVYYMHGEGSKNEALIGAGAICILVLIYILKLS